MKINSISVIPNNYQNTKLYRHQTVNRNIIQNSNNISFQSKKIIGGFITGSLIGGLGAATAILTGKLCEPILWGTLAGVELGAQAGVIGGLIAHVNDYLKDEEQKS